MRWVALSSFVGLDVMVELTVPEHFLFIFLLQRTDDLGDEQTEGQPKGLVTCWGMPLISSACFWTVENCWA